MPARASWRSRCTAWLARRAGIELPEGPLTVAIADGESADGLITGTAVGVPWGRAAAPVLLVHGPDGPLVGLLDAGITTLTEHHNLAGEPRDAIAFDVPAEQ